MPLPAVLTVLLSTLALLVGTVFSALAARRAGYERVMKALDFVSEGTVAKARHRLGAVVYQYADELASGGLISSADLDAEVRSSRVEDLFTILWAARRVEATRRSLGSEWAARGPHRLLRDSVAKWVQWWVEEEPDAGDRMRIEAVATWLDATVDRDDDLDGLITLRDAWKVPRSKVVRGVPEADRRPALR